MSGGSLESRLEAAGIAPRYEDTFGTVHELAPEAAEQLLWAMRLDDQDARPPAEDAVIVTGPDRRAPSPSGELVFEEDRGTRRVEGRLPASLPLGYHRLHRDDGDTTEVIVSPGRCAPHPTEAWGWSLQLYSLLSVGSWGVGDLADLRGFGALAREQGAAAVLVNPLEAVVQGAPRGASPYFPSSRRFLDPLYLRVEEVPGASAAAPSFPVLSTATPPRDGRIDRDAVVEAKYRALELVWRGTESAGREEAFLRFRRERGASLERFATFEALSETHGDGWRSWPAAYRVPGSPAVGEFATEHADRVRFHAWVQWLLDEQLRSAALAAPLLRDLPIGFDPGGADAWEWQDVLARDVTVGAPPDELGPAGQDWGLPAFVPWRLRAAAYRPFVQTLRAALRHTSGLRIDHVLGLFRLFWTPEAGPAAGSYVRQDTDALLDILALESHRAGAYVVGEDLGTVGPGVREELARRRVLGYRVFWFEEEPPEAWDEGAVGAVTTHDLPSVGGVWTGTDLELHRSLGLEVDEERLEQMRRDLVETAGVEPDADLDEVCVAAATMLARAGCDLVLVQLDDAVGATHRINVPGTDATARPENWSIVLPCSLEELERHPLVRRVVAALTAQRGRIPRNDDEVTR